MIYSNGNSKGLRTTPSSLARSTWTAVMVTFLSAGTLGATLRPIVFRSSGPDGQIAAQTTPEYDRNLKRVLITVPVVERGIFRSTHAVEPELLDQVYSEIIAALPDYTSLEIILRQRDQSAVESWLEKIALSRRVTLYILSPSEVKPDFWTQDVGESIRSEDGECFLVSMVLNHKFGYNHEVSEDRLQIAQEIFGRRETCRADFAFEGGNVMFDQTPLGARMLIGYDDILITQENYQADGMELSLQGVTGLIAEQMGTDVVVLGHEMQSRFMPHIDQSFILLADSVAVIHQVPGSQSLEAGLLRDYRSQLEGLGYRIITIETTDADIQNGYTSTNAIAFIDAVTKQREIIYPVFPGEVKGGAGRHLGKSDLIGKGLRAYTAYEAAGYLPLPVRDSTHTVGGSTHCIVNVVE